MIYVQIAALVISLAKMGYDAYQTKQLQTKAEDNNNKKMQQDRVAANARVQNSYDQKAASQTARPMMELAAMSLGEKDASGKPVYNRNKLNKEIDSTQKFEPAPLYGYGQTVDTPATAKA